MLETDNEARKLQRADVDCRRVTVGRSHGSSICRKGYDVSRRRTDDVGAPSTPCRGRSLYARELLRIAFGAATLAAIGAALAAIGAAGADGEIAPAGLDARRARIFQQACAHCHARPEIGVPLIGDAVAWKARAAQGLDVLVANTVNGIGNMPPLGTCGFCSEKDLRILAAFLAGLPADAGVGGAGP